MIEVRNDGVLVEGNLGSKAVKLLWELIDVVGFRYVIVGELGQELAETRYDNSYEVVNRKSVKVIIFKCDSKQDYVQALKVLSDLCISDFYISVNASFKKVVNLINSPDMFMRNEFLIEEYLIEYPKTIHITEERFFIEFDEFREYIHQLTRVAERYK